MHVPYCSLFIFLNNYFLCEFLLQFVGSLQWPTRISSTTPAPFNSVLPIPAGSNTLVGSTGGVGLPGDDTFTILTPTSVDFTVNGSGFTTTLTGIEVLDGTIVAGGFGGDTGADTYNLGAVTWARSINGAMGSDTINTTTAVTATITTITNASLTSATNSFTGGGFLGIETLNTGAGSDVITLSMAPTDMTDANLINLGAGTDRIDALFAADWLINATNGGFVRDAAANAARVAFAGVENLTSTGSSIIDMPAAGFSIAGTFSAPVVTFAQNVNNAGVLGMRINAAGGINGPAVGGLALVSGVGGIDIIGPLTTSGPFVSTTTGTAIYRSVTTTGFNQTYNGATELQGNLSGANMVFNGTLNINGAVVLDSSTNIWDFNSQVTSWTSDVLSIVPDSSGGPVDIFIDLVDGQGHVSSNKFGGFNGFLSIGGEFVPAATTTPVFDGDLLSATADQITIAEPLETGGGNVVLVGSNIIFAPTNVATDIVLGKTGPAR